MRLVIQRVTQASVTVSGSVVGAINKGYLVLVGIGQNDTEAIVEKMADKMMRLRIFSDENDKINLSLQDVGGQLLLVSQFTLYADCRKGNNVINLKRLLNGKQNVWKYQNGEEKSDSDGREKDV